MISRDRVGEGRVSEYMEVADTAEAERVAAGVATDTQVCDWDAWIVWPDDDGLIGQIVSDPSRVLTATPVDTGGDPVIQWGTYLDDSATARMVRGTCRVALAYLGHVDSI
jgi:hypothetical protein